MQKPARFVDAHVHLWDLDRLSYPWLTAPYDDTGVTGNVESIAQTYLLDDYLVDASAWTVTGIVHVDAGAAPAHALDETVWLQSMADDRGMPNAIVGFAALNDKSVEAVLERQASHANVRGIRHIANWHADPNKSYTPVDLTGDSQWQAGFALLGKYGLRFDCQIYPGQMGAIAALAAKHPDVPVILNHAGMLIDAGPDALEEWRSGMRALAALPHVTTKLSGYGIVDHRWTTESIRPRVLEAIEIFGADRCLFASDFPTEKLFGSYNRWLDAFVNITADFSADERDALFAGNALHVYGIAA